MAAFLAIGGAGSARAGDFDISEAQFQTGGIVIVAPRYEGSKSYEVRGLPFVLPGAKGGDSDLTFSDIDSIQYRLVKYGAFEAGPLAGAWLGRESDDGAKLEGLGNIDAGLVVGGYAALKFGATKFTASYHHQVTGEDVGSLVRLRAETEIPLTDGIKFLVGAGTNFATNGYMDTNFGVSAQQAANSVAGLTAYNPDAGIKDVFAGAGFEVELTERLTGKVYGEYSRLVGDAGDSPVIDTRDQFSGLLAVTYQFGPSGDPAVAQLK